MAAKQQTQQDANLQVAFEPGSTAVYAVTSSSVLHLSFDAADVLFDQRGDDLVLTDASGNEIVIEGYIALVEAGTSPQVVMDDGVTVAGDVFLLSMGEDETAADAVADSGGLNSFFSDPGSMVGGAEGMSGPGSEGPENGDGLPGGTDYDSPVDFIAQADDQQGSVDPFPVIEEGVDHGISERFDHFLIRQAYVAEADDTDTWRIIGTRDADEIGGGAGRDELQGSRGDDTIYGNDGHDVLSGRSGNDLLFGGSGDDLMGGGTGNDTIYGGGGYDTISGDSGADLFVFNNNTFGDGSAIVEISDFEIGVDGVQLLDGVGFEALREVYVDHDSNAATADLLSTEVLMGNGSDDNVILRLLGETRADFDSHIDSLGDSYAYSDTEQLMQYMAGNESSWVV